MTTPIDANEFLMGGGAKGAAFPSIGTRVTGRITGTPTVRQQTDPQTKEPKFFKNGDPMMQLVVPVDTDQRDPAVPDDDGSRAFYVKSKMLAAVREAVSRSGAKGLEVGGILTVTYVGDGQKTAGALSAPKLYTAQYQPPQAQAANEYLMSGNGQPAAPAQPTVPAHPPQPSQSPAENWGVPATPVPPPPAGVDPALWTQMSAEQRASVLAAMSGVR